MASEFRTKTSSWKQLSLAVHPRLALSLLFPGIYERNWKANGQKSYHYFDRKLLIHPIDNQLASLTIVSDKSVDGEIWTTRLFGDSLVLSLEKVESVMESKPSLLQKIIKFFYSSGLSPEIISLNPERTYY